MKRIFTFFVLFFNLHIVLAQTKLLTMEDALLKHKTSLAPAKLKQLQWIKGSELFSYTQRKNNSDFLIIQGATQKTPQQEISIATVNEALKTVNEGSQAIFPEIRWKNKNQFFFDAGNRTFLYDISKKQITIEDTLLTNTAAENKDVAAKTNYTAFTVKNNLFVFDGKNELIVTNDADENIVNGIAAHREEFGIMKGTFWSPTGNLLAFYKMDQRMVTDYPIIDWTVRPAKVNFIKYPMAGDKSHEVTVGVYNVQTGKAIFLQTGEPKEQYLTNIAWSPDEQHIYMAVVNRAQNHMKFNSYSAVTGYFEKTLFEETNEKYVQPLHPMVFVPNHPDQFIWLSERDGYRHIFLYNLKGECKQLTKGKWVVTSICGFDSKGNKVFYTSTAESSITRNVYSVDFKKTKITRITSGDGMHGPWYSEKEKSNPWLSDNGKYALDNFQSTTVPREIAVYSTQGKKINSLLTAENPLSDYKLGDLRILKLKSESGEDLFCRMYTPVNFDSTKKYPVIIWQYNGPNIQLVHNSWNAAAPDLWSQYMAERGFIIFTMDGRGTANRGLAFEQATFQHLGNQEMKDQLVGVNYLKKMKFVDSLRIGLYGWSYGGFMTISMMTRYPGIFKTAVAGGPVIDWSYYEIMYTERYMDTPQENPKGYAESNLLQYIDKLKGKLLIIHGTQDNVVVWQNSLMYLKACVDKGKQVDYFVYPGHEHNVLGKDREQLFQKVTEYFIQNL